MDAAGSRIVFLVFLGLAGALFSQSEIKDWEFYNTSSASISVPNGIVSIGRASYACSYGLKKLELPDTLQKIGPYAFCMCFALSDFRFPHSLECIEEKAFFECHSISEIVVPNSVTNIGSSAFAQCDGLTNATIGSGCISLSLDAFSGCPRFSSFSVDNGNPMFSVANGLLVSKDKKRIVLGVNGRVEIPDGTEVICSNSFRRCMALESLTIPNSVTNIEKDAFYGCRNLTNVLCYASNSITNNNPFSDCPTNLVIEFLSAWQ